MWEEKTVNVDYMFYGAGMGNPEAMNPVMCAQRCALDVHCGAFEYDFTPETNYCVWWDVGACDVGHPNATNNFCAKINISDAPQPAQAFLPTGFSTHQLGINDLPDVPDNYQ